MLLVNATYRVLTRLIFHVLFVNTDFQPHASTDIPGEHVSRLIARNPDSFEHPDFQFSKCTGRKKALCVSPQCPLHISL